MEEEKEQSVAYEIYKKNVGGKTYDGTPMKLFHELPDRIRKAWKAIDKECAPRRRFNYWEEERKAKMRGEELCDCKFCRNVRCDICADCWETVIGYAGSVFGH